MSTKAPKRKRASAAVRDAAPMAAPEMDAVDLQAADTATLAILVPETVDAVTHEAAPAPLEAGADATAIMETTVVADLPDGFPIDPIVALPSNSTVKDAGALKTELMKLLEVPTSVVIDARGVERVDTATVQLLYAFVRDRAERNGMVEWLGRPQALVDAVRLLGVQEVLALPAAGAA